MKKALITIVAILITSLSFAQLNPLVIGTINPGDSIVIYYDVTINTLCGCTQISNQGTVSGSNFLTFNTDDPDTGPTADATITLLNMFPLPVTFYELSAAPKTTGIEVKWKVGYETDMVGYEVERSSNGRQFIKIGEVAALNQASGATYSFFDVNPNNGVNFYRLKLIDRAASVKYSIIVRVDLSGKNATITIYPNPVAERQVTLQLNNMVKGNYKLVFFNNIGQAVYSKMINHDGGSVSRNITLPGSLSAGVYSVQLQNEKALFNQLLMVK